MPLTDVQRMIQVNTMAVTSLTHLFGRDMKERRRGRILLVSSICGAVSGIATVAVYAATKAYENSFGAGLGKELEPYGIGVTSLMPGAVRGTEFRSRSNSQEALCWKLPFYLKSAPSVAESGVRALLHGDTEVTPGVLNRLFVKVMKPVLPQRMHNLLAEIMWNPIQWPFQSRTSKSTPDVSEVLEHSKLESNSSIVDIPNMLRYPIIVRPQLWSTQSPPRILQIKEPVQENHQVIQVEEEEDIPDDSTTSLSVNEKGDSIKIEGNDNVDDKPNVASSEMTLNMERNDTNVKMGITTNDLEERRMEERRNERQRHLQLSELDLLLEQYKRHRSISIDDPWSSQEYIDGYMERPMLPSIKENDRKFM
jgi:hypothetical protein